MFTLLYGHYNQHILTFSSNLEAFYALKQMGVTQLETPPHRGLRGKHYLKTLFKCMHDTPRLTFEVGIFIARKS